MAARAEAVEGTRHRITAATVRLHEEIGPAATTVSAIAEEAGVTRLTVYRHFPDEESLVAACSAHWRQLHPRPEVDRWRRITDPLARLRVALAEMYAWHQSAAPMEKKILRDLDSMPSFVRDGLAMDMAQRVRVLARGLATTPAARRRVKPVVAHALSLSTWQALCREGGLSTDEAVDIMTAAVLAAAGAARGTG